MAVLPHAAKLAWVLQQFGGKKADDGIRDAVKIADLRGAIFTRGPDGQEHAGPKKLSAELDTLAAGIRLSGGMLSPHDFLMFTRQSGLAGKLMDPKAFYDMAAEAMVAMGPSRAGTAETSLLQQFVWGNMPVHSAVEMQKMGLLRKGE